jgi:hypothetical protein
MGYRHPPCIIVLLEENSRSSLREASKAEKCMKNFHVQIELIEEIFDSIPCLCSFLCILIMCS